LYYNNGNGTFKESSDNAFNSMSMGSMGADACDIDNDLLPDLFVTEMLPSSIERKLTKNQYESWDKYQVAVNNGYHHQFSRNVLQKNMGDGRFVEIGRLAGVEATEWSWASIIQDFDNDGFKDLFVSNGLYKDLLDKDYLAFSADRTMIKSKIDAKSDVISMLIDSMPSTPIKNCMFRNNGKLEFTNVSDDWGFDQETFSNGSAYGDLDNDGDLDLIVNNVNMKAYVYRNNLDTATHRSITLTLVGKGLNTNAIGAKVISKSGKLYQMIENFTSKGFQSSIDNRVHIGFGNQAKIDSLWIVWPDRSVSVMTNLESNKAYIFKQNDAKFDLGLVPRMYNSNGRCKEINLFEFKHQDISLNLFTNERLLLEMPGFNGPAIAIGDVNGDGRDDVFCGGGRNQESVLFLDINGKWVSKYDFKEEIKSEAQDADFADLDNDGDLDLYIAHGGKSFSEYANELYDMIYINDGKGMFSLKENAIKWPKPISSSAVSIVDINADKLKDIIIGESGGNQLFGLPGSIYIALNKGNNVFEIIQPNSLKDLGMISDLQTGDFDKDGFVDIVVGGLWMPIKVVLNNKGSFSNSKIINIPNTSGLWRTIKVEDINDDGYDDIIAGNEGLNTFYKHAKSMFVNDFDGNGMKEQLVCSKNEKGKYFPIHDIDEVFSQLPTIKKKYLHYKDYVKADMTSLVGNEKLNNAKVFHLEKLESTILYNNKKLGFNAIDLPLQFQMSTIHSILIDKRTGLLYVGGNTRQIKPQWGKQDASYGWSARFINKDGKVEINDIQSLGVKGDIRNIKSISKNLIFGINNNNVLICEK
jgi:hypothetical protein